MKLTTQQNCDIIISYWCNSLIRVAGQPIPFESEPARRGLIRISDLYVEECGRLKTPSEAQAEFGITPMLYNSVTTAIPKSTKHYIQECMRQNIVPIENEHVSEIIFCDQPTKLFKIKHELPPPDIVRKSMRWSEELKEDVSGRRLAISM